MLTDQFSANKTESELKIMFRLYKTTLERGKEVNIIDIGYLEQFYTYKYTYDIYSSLL